MGGQTALNTALALFKDGTLDRLGIELIGANAEAIEKAEDRLEIPRGDGPDRARQPALGDRAYSFEVRSRGSTCRAARDHPPDFTLGGTGGGIAYNRDEFEAMSAAGSRRRRPPKC